MKILLFGKNGQLGWELNRSLQPFGDIVALGRQDADFSRPEALRKIIRDIEPDILVNAVAYTAVDGAESDQDTAGQINSVAPGVIAEEANRLNALLIHYSTDYVFDGAGSRPYQEDDMPGPLNVYGRTKLEGEQLIQSSGCDYLIFRTSWVYASRGKNFLLTILRLARERDELNIVSDQNGSPTPARLIAEATALCLCRATAERKKETFSSDIYHLTASGQTSWYAFAAKIIELLKGAKDFQVRVGTLTPILTKDYPTAAVRPMMSCLDTRKIQNKFFIELPDWEQSLKLVIEELRA